METNDAPATPALALYRYEFYAYGPSGITIMPIIAVISPEAVDSPTVRAAVKEAYMELLRKHGIGAIPRPTHYSAVELPELPELPPAAVDDEASSDAPPRGIVIPHQNGAHEQR